MFVGFSGEIVDVLPFSVLFVSFSSFWLGLLLSSFLTQYDKIVLVCFDYIFCLVDLTGNAVS